MDLDKIKRLVAGAETATDATREEASEMLVFGRVTQWDDEYSDACQTSYRGQFDLIKPKRNRILAELQSNPVSVEFKPRDGASIEAAEALNGMFMQAVHDGEEAIETAQMDQLDCGYGAFRFVTSYESKFDDLSANQKIDIADISEANNVVYWDPNAKRKDKSDARWCLILNPFTKDGWENYCKENGIKEQEDATSFSQPNSTNVFFWGKNSKSINIGEFYHKEKKRRRVLIFENPLGDRVAYYESEVKSKIDEIEEGGYEKVGQKYKDQWEVTKYLISGTSIIKSQRCAGEFIPVIPIYGDWSYVEQREIWRGIYHDAQDAQRLHNFQMSYVADIVAEGAREKPIFTPEQIKGFEWMYHKSGADNNLPFVYQNRTHNGEQLAMGPVAYLQNPSIPQGAAALLEYTRQSVDDVTGSSSTLSSMMNSQVTEGQIQAAQGAQNLETFLFQNSYQLAMKHAARVFASMAQEIYDTPREVTIRKEDGTEKSVALMEQNYNVETDESEVLRDLTKGSFAVVADTAPSYSTQREQTRSEMRMLATELAGTEIGNMAMLYYILMQDGPMMSGLRDWAKEQLMLLGQIEPESEADMQKLAELQQMQQMQANQPDPAMVMAEAENQKAIADQMNAQVKEGELQVKAFEAETKRAKVMAENNLTAAQVEKTMTEINGNELDNVQKIAGQLMPQGFQLTQ